ncbi:MAG TPA: MFS transporter [Clostridiaceae bacterium]
MKKKFSIVTIFFTVFLDLLGLGIIIPILPALFYDPFGGILPISYSYSTRTLLIGLLIAAYPIAQFFGAPILGTLADRLGRKKVLLISLIGTFIGYTIVVIAVIQSNVTLLFIGRMIDGFTGGNISIAQSAIADVSDEKTKSRNFGLIGMAFGLGFIIGPYIGGKLSDPTVVSWFTFATPFYLSIFLCGINIALVVLNFPETFGAQLRRNVKISALTGFKNIGRAIKLPNLRTMFIVSFLLTMGFNFFTQFFQVFLFTKYHYTQSMVGDFFAYMGLWIAISQGILLRPVVKRVEADVILKVAVLLLGISIPMLIIPNQKIYLYLIVPFIAVFQGFVQPSTLGIISNLTGVRTQGEVLGINQSVNSLAMAIPPIISGFVTSVNVNLPTIFAGGATLLAWLVFITYYKKEVRSEDIVSK